ncbi:MAG: winged helix DNA-binding domain-containing protein, partial [Actinobacteria bacterium]|nr:winged helix DNA-binding domain-containing protein [Actinomycetota bacterium]
MASLSWEQVTSWRLARGHLARRVGAAGLVPVVADMCGAHAQIMSSVPLALASRVARLKHARVDAALQEERTLVKTWAMRGTLHVLTADDLPLYCAAQRTRDQYTNPSFLKYFGLELADIEAVLDAIPRALDGQVLTREELANRILQITKRPHLAERLLSGWGEMLKPAAFRGLMCFGPQSGRAVTFVRPDQWVGRWNEYDTDDALQKVFRRFLSTYGPASRAEVARWWGVRPPEAGRVLKLMEQDLAEVECGGSKRWVLKNDLRSLKSARVIEGVRFLPSFDQLLVMSAPHSEAIVDSTYKERIYRARIAV